MTFQNVCLAFPVVCAALSACAAIAVPFSAFFFVVLLLVRLLLFVFFVVFAVFFVSAALLFLFCVLLFLLLCAAAFRPPTLAAFDLPKCQEQFCNPLKKSITNWF